MERAARSRHGGQDRLGCSRGSPRGYMARIFIIKALATEPSSFNASNVTRLGVLADRVLAFAARLFARLYRVSRYTYRNRARRSLCPHRFCR